MKPGRLVLLALFGLCLLGSANSSPKPTSRLTLESGTPLEIAVVQDVDSGSLKSGDLVHFRVTRPVLVKGIPVVASEAPARGVAVYSRAARVGGRGELLVQVEDVAAVDGTWIPLRVRPARDKGLAGLVPAECMDLSEPVFPKGRNGRLSSQRTLEAWTAARQDFLVTSAGTSHKVVAAPLTPPKGLPGTPVRLVAGTLVSLRPASEIVSDQVVTGDAVPFVTSQELVLNGQTLVAAGAPATGTVLLAREAAAANHGGVLVLGIESVQGVDGRAIPLRLSSATSGSGNHVISLGISAVVPLVGLAVHGRNAVVPVDHEFVVAVAQDCLVVVPPTPTPVPEAGVFRNLSASRE
jgi:hypothetical protein